MKIKATARWKFCDVYQEGNSESRQRLDHTCIHRFAEAVRQRLGLECENHPGLKPRNRPNRGFSSTLLFNPPPIGEISPLLRNGGAVFSTTYEWRLNCHLSDAIVIATRNQMLRITRKVNGEVVFKVSGQLTAENVTEMETLVAAETKGRRIVLDCSDLRSVDSEAVKFLEKLEADSIKLKNCGLYIREWIRRERLERKSGKSQEA